ncbi:hypothetical protein OGATHE_002076 [Ogataea polymorpha]|uniref:Uncharacterized protein n=1 Tax=Ogataea polymorpha TaxID=460523 RepID=A0A9P8PL95_9ASCO|nr:hypothetical protein OGATHE_002076 [Ogataea polymorpha]
MRTGFCGECCLMAMNAGLFIVFISGQKAKLSGNPSIYICNGTGRTLGGKLNKPSLTPSQPPMSMALEMAVDRPRSLIGFLVKDETKFILLTMISKIGPLSLASRCISSIITSETSCTNFRVCQLREIPSNFSGVVIIMSDSRTSRASGSESPVISTTRCFVFLEMRSLQSSTRSLTRAFIGAIYTTLDPGNSLKACQMASSATTVFPDPVGEPTNTLELVLYSVWNTIVCIGLK